MDIEGPGAGRRILLLMLAFAHLGWAAVLTFAAYVAHQVEVQGFDVPEPPNWVPTVAMLALAAYSVSAAAKTLRADQELTADARRYVGVATIAQPLVTLVALSL